MKLLFIIVQYVVPQHLLSRLVGRFAASRTPWLKNRLIELFIRHYSVDMSEAAEPDPRYYASFNDFFTRALREGARPIAEGGNVVVCPADGSISQIGRIRGGRIFQAKGHDYSLVELLGGNEEDAAPFMNGHFATIYLSPKDYHRVHMPLGGELRAMNYVPGDLFSVNNTTAENVIKLFARNERAVCLFDTAAGPMAVVMVGAMIVAGIETAWSGQVTPLPDRVQRTDYRQLAQPIRLATGAEMGRFKLGSTVIVLLPDDKVQWLDSYVANSATRMGEALGEIQT